MPGLSLSPNGINQSRTVNQMCRQDSRVHLSADDVVAAEESLSMYCKPVELYNILERRAVQNPSFLQRTLNYKIKAKHKKRLKLTISLSWSMNKDEQVQGIFPLYVLLATSVPELATGGHSAVFCCRTRARILKSLCEFERNDSSQANFVLPEMNKLSSDESRSGKLFILLVSCGNKRNFLSGGNPLNGHMDTSSSPASIGGYCLWGKIPLDSYISWDDSRTEHGSGMLSTVVMHACFLESSSLEKEQCITFKTPDSPVTMPVRVNVFTQEGGVKDQSPYCSFAHSGHRISSIPHITGIRTGNVVFNYKYYNNALQKTEVTEDFTCAFCLVKCASFKGLRCHLCASHDLFNYEFWVTEEYQAVNVSVRTDIWRSENAADRVNPRLQTFFLCSKRLKRTTLSHSSQNAKHVHTSDQKLGSCGVTRNGFFTGLLEREAGTSSLPVPSITNPMDTDPTDQAPQIYDNETQSSKQRDKAQKVLLNDNDLWNDSNGENNGATNASVVECLEHVAASPNVTGPSTATNQSSAELECPPLVPERNLAPPAMLQFAKSRKLSADRSDPRNRILLQKRQFFHSHRAQPMELEQVLSDRDSEDEVDDDIADLEDRRMLDDFVDVTKDEKQMMHFWNSFVRKQRVLADGHIPWACEAFSKMHGPELAQSPPLFWCWRLFMIKLWNHSLLDASTMNRCNKILSEFNNDSKDPPQS